MMARAQNRSPMISEGVNESPGRGAPRLRRGAPSAGGVGGRPEPPMFSEINQSFQNPFQSRCYLEF